MEPVRWIFCEDADLPALVLGRWRVADEIKEGEEDPDSTKTWWFGYNILSSLSFRLVFSLGSSNVCRNRLGLDSARLYISVVRDQKNLIHIQYNKFYNFFVLFRWLRLFFSFFDEFFQVNQGRLTFERLDLLVSFRFAEYIWALATECITVVSFKSIQKLSSWSRLWLPGVSLSFRLDLFTNYWYRLDL